MYEKNETEKHSKIQSDFFKTYVSSVSIARMKVKFLTDDFLNFL
ncbi:hypothetical protein FUAX_21800 [Fulvitalea axinellae]|uniref:Integrase n=1 Tax=Fulvitalea axinellae TaxID=1182444 RepID=A0AAU9CI73_9BACT|nr:hypothetical protein FUAX_21800 [Fulvitalea axinellae]